MTVTWPIPPNSTIDPRTRPVPFQTERDVSAVSVSFGSRRAEERAFRDGSFVWPYLRSTREGNLFTLVRDDGTPGWPADPKPFVDEVPPPTPAPTTFWDVLLDVDLSAWATQSIPGAAGGAGSSGVVYPTLGGLQWVVKWYSSGAMAGSVVSGLGVNLTATGFNDISAYGGAYFMLPETQIPGYDNAKFHCVQAKFRHASDPVAMPNGMLVGAYATSFPALTISPAYDARWGCHAAMFNNGSAYAAHYSNGTGYGGALVYSGGYYLPLGGGTPTNLREFTFGVMIEPTGFGRYGLIARRPGNNGFCAIEDMIPVGASWAGAGSSPYEFFGAFFGSLAGGSSCNRYLSHLRILQKAM